MDLSRFDYSLPKELIATHPMEPRDHCRLLRIDRNNGKISHHRFDELKNLLLPNHKLVINDTKVLPARLFASDGKRSFELLLLEQISEDCLKWKCLVRPGKKIKTSLEVKFTDGTIAKVSRDNERFTVKFLDRHRDNFRNWLWQMGQMPIPPYLERESTEADKQDYQTYFAEQEGSVAAPTAGLHFTPELITALRNRGIPILPLTLHVGYGTFSPIQVQNIQMHQMHEEHYEIPKSTVDEIQTGKPIAVGTTSLRALEASQLKKLRGRTDIFIYPGYSFQVVQSLITNFHLPKSSLFVLVCALLGEELAHEAYQVAIAERYRFYSYGDAMWID